MQDTEAEGGMVGQERVGRRRLIGTTGAGAAAFGALAATLFPSNSAHAQAVTDVAIANFALNFEYLGAELYSRALTGQGLAASDTTGGNGQASGGVTGGARVPFKTLFVAQLISQFAADELAHVRVLRQALGSNAIPEPAIDLQKSFATIAQLAGLGAGFNAFADENSLLQASYSIEDVCVTALRGAVPLIQNKTVLSIVSGFLGVEAYQASAVRVLLYQNGFAQATDNISNLRAQLSQAADDTGTVNGSNVATIVPSDGSGLVYARNTRQVLNVAYGAVNATAGGFFPNGVNGTITS